MFSTICSILRAYVGNKKERFRKSGPLLLVVATNKQQKVFSELIYSITVPSAL